MLRVECRPLHHPLYVILRRRVCASAKAYWWWWAKSSLRKFEIKSKLAVTKWFKFRIKITRTYNLKWFSKSPKSQNHYQTSVIDKSLNSHILFRPPGPVSAGRRGLYILLLHFFYFFAICTCRRESARHPPTGTIKRVSPLAMLIKYPQTFDPCCPPFYRGAKCPQILAQISTPIVFGPPYFWTAPLYRKSKTNLAGIYDRPITIPNMG